jgi:hypothetical protein
MKSLAALAHDPLVLAFVWYVVAGLAALLIGRKSRIDAWCAAHPKAAFAVHVLRATGLDVWKLVGAAQALARSRAGLPPVLPTLLFVGLLMGCGSAQQQAKVRVDLDLACMSAAATANEIHQRPAYELLIKACADRLAYNQAIAASDAGVGTGGTVAVVADTTKLTCAQVKGLDPKEVENTTGIPAAVLLDVKAACARQELINLFDSLTPTHVDTPVATGGTPGVSW